jgi:hypothetical protein
MLSATIEAETGCVFHYPQYGIWLLLAISVPFSAALSSVFCYIVVKQCRLYESNAWKRLTWEGIQAMRSAALCNIVRFVVIATQIIGSLSDLTSAIE